MQTLGNILQKKFIGTDDLRRQLTEILDKLPEEGGEIVVTQHGKPQAVLVDLESYLETQEQIADNNPQLITRLNKALKKAESGEKVAANKVFQDLDI